MLDYMNPESTATVRQAMRELQVTEAMEGERGDMSSMGALAPQMTPHDAVHVIFACGTSLFGEVQAHLWMMFGTTARMADMHDTAGTRDHRAVLADIGFRRLAWVWLRAIPEMASILFRSRRMTRSWPVEELDSFLDRSLKEIRTEYAIRLRPVSG